MSTGSELYDLLAKTNATLNPNNTITLRFNDGSSYTTGVIKDGPELSPADKAMDEAKEASVISQAAMEEANKAAVAAGNAEQSASEAAASATNAENFASEAQQSASAASTAATNAETSAGNAATSASNAATNAQAAATSASAAEGSAQTAATEASEAKTQANMATKYANSALNSLSTMQDVIGVLEWASQHGTFAKTTDTTIQEGKVYFTYDSQTGDYLPVILPQESELSNYYELTVNEAMQSFIMAHLAVTSRGLWVLPNGINTGSVTPASGETMENARARLGNDYKVLLSSDGMHVYDDDGVEVSVFGENITFSATRAQYIGNEDAFIVFNPEDGTINAGGEGFRFNNNTTLSEMLAEVGKVGRLEDDTNGLLQKTSSISYENGELILSDSKSAFAVKITNTKLSFMQGEQEVAYITGNQLYIPYTVVLNAMDIGPWRWRKQDNGNLTLQYIG